MLVVVRVTVSRQVHRQCWYTSHFNELVQHLPSEFETKMIILLERNQAMPQAANHRNDFQVECTRRVERRGNDVQQFEL